MNRVPLKSPKSSYQEMEDLRVRGKKRKVVTVRHKETIMKLTEEFTGGVRTSYLVKAIV